MTGELRTALGAVDPGPNPGVADPVVPCRVCGHPHLATVSDHPSGVEFTYVAGCADCRCTADHNDYYNYRCPTHNLPGPCARRF